MNAAEGVGGRSSSSCQPQKVGNTPANLTKAIVRNISCLYPNRFNQIVEFAEEYSSRPVNSGILWKFQQSDVDKARVEFEERLQEYQQQRQQMQQQRQQMQQQQQQMQQQRQQMQNIERGSLQNVKKRKYKKQGKAGEELEEANPAEKTEYGIVDKSHGDCRFSVELVSTGEKLFCRIAGGKKRNTHVKVGDYVLVYNDTSANLGDIILKYTPKDIIKLQRKGVLTESCSFQHKESNVVFLTSIPTEPANYVWNFPSDSDSDPDSDD